MCNTKFSVCSTLRSSAYLLNFASYFYLLPLRVHICRKLESGVEPGVNPRHFNIRCGCPKGPVHRCAKHLPKCNLNYIVIFKGLTRTMSTNEYYHYYYLDLHPLHLYHKTMIQTSPSSLFKK